jgi:hypothetical protein
MVCPKSYHRVDSLASHIHKLHFQDIWQFGEYCLGYGRYKASLTRALTARAHGYIPPGNQPALAVNQPAPVNQLAPPMHQPAIANQFDPRMQQVAPPNLFPHAMHPTAPYDLATLQVAPADHSAPAMHHGTPMSLFAPGFLQPAAPMNEPMPMANQQPAPLLYQAAPVDDPQAANQQNTAEHQYPDPAN